MGKKKTPLIQQLRESGGTLYVFPSASEDIGLNLQSTTTGVAMSHYALLNIPQLSINKCLCDAEGASAKNGNQALAMSLQNYMMNFETHLTNREEYNYQENATVTEKVFWHWAEKIGMIKKDNFGMLKDTSVYYETGRDADQNVVDDTVIKVFGSIDAGNSLSTEFGMYNETYINIPTSYGAGPVYLRSSETENYKLNYKYKPEDDKHLEGRDDTYSYYSYFMGQDIPYFDDTQNKLYQTNEEFDGLEIVKEIPLIQNYARKQFNNDSIVISSYDDLNIDVQNNFNVDIKFDFNAVLLYYSVYDQDDINKTAYATNLFGIIFLDGAQIESSTEGDGFNIPTKSKLKSTTTAFGDSFSFRVNLKTMSVYDNTDAIIQDNTTMSGISAVDFSDAISNMNKAIDIMNSNVHTTSAIQNQYAAIMAYYDAQEDTIKDLSTNLNAYLHGSRSAVVNTSTLYTNIIIPNPENGNNTLTLTTYTGAAGSIVNLNETPELTISQNNVEIPTLNSRKTTSIYNYVKEEGTTSKDSIINQNSTQDVSVMKIIDIMNKSFASTDNLVVRLKNDYDFINTVNETAHVAIHNQLYIDNNSSIFRNSTDSVNLSYLKDTSGNLNYIGMIPYLIAQIQRLTEDVSILQNKLKNK